MLKKPKYMIRIEEGKVQQVSMWVYADAIVPTILLVNKGKYALDPFPLRQTRILYLIWLWIGLQGKRLKAAFSDEAKVELNRNDPQRIRFAVRMMEHALEAGSEFFSGEVIQINQIEQNHEVVTKEGDHFIGRTVLIASGTVEHKLGIAGEIELYARGVSYCAVCDGGLFRGKEVVVIGGGNSAMEEAAYLADVVKKVHLVHRRQGFRARVESVTIESTLDKTRKELIVQGVFPYVGLDPVTNFVKDKKITDENKYLIVNQKMETTIPGLYAAGDVLNKPLRQVVTAVGDGAVAVIEAKNYLNRLDGQDLIKAFKKINLPISTRQRRTKHFLYSKRSEHISDILKAMGAVEMMIEMENGRVTKDLNSQLTKLNNIEIANSIKTINLSTEQLSTIDHLNLASISPSLALYIRYRRKHPSHSLSELVKTINRTEKLSLSRSWAGHMSRALTELGKTSQSQILNAQSVIHDRDEIVEAVKLVEKFNKEAIPVLSSDNKLIGVISDNDIVGHVIEEATEDINRMSGISELRFSYVKASTLSIFKSRILWLSILMVSATLSSIVIDQFSNFGASITAGVSTAMLIPIMTVISGSSGNAGSQASVSVIRSITLGLSAHTEVLANGTLKMNPYELAVIVSASASLCLMIAIVLAKMVGAMLPFLAVKLKIDPAVMAAPLLTTLLDATSTAIFFGLGILTIKLALGL
ncbi:unnamed protein product [Didymodactylos carnosus]|uniref:CBS domain-containing protein n=1 Tax=Didymodactylos carnosus TaxID=1234261 RepID=A0A8S2GP05_9BILA|nr:unnamed protein product [Didymodactylos carnosus]CAF3540321.1 unnamed protein product [Didymodactylos carnosus]